MAGRRDHSSAHSRENKSFLRELRQFHENHGCPFRHPPRLNGHEVDLHRLYSDVTAAGGWHKVNHTRRWGSMLKALNVPTECPNAGLAVKHIYLRYLDHYEKIHFHGEDLDDEIADTSDNRGRKSLTALYTVPMTYNHHQHVLSDAVRVQLGISHDPSSSSTFNDRHQRLVLSFLSSQPNEVDFALNVCTLLSFDGNGILRLDRHPRMIDLLVAQAGIFNDAAASIPGLLEGSLGVYQSAMAAFWEDTLEDDEARELLGPWRETSGGKKCVGEDRSLFNLSQSLGIRGREGQRVVQVATIVQNLSYDECNMSVMASSPVCLKFLLLCAYSRWSNLRQLSFDTLSNLCAEMALEPYDDLYTQLIYRTVVRNLLVDDRFLLIRGLEMLAGLCKVTSNSYVLVRAIEDKVYRRVCSLLSVRDLMVLVYALECLYRITELGREPCTRIAQIRGVIDNLVGLVTMDAQLYGPEASINMKLVDTPMNATTSATSATASATTSSVVATTTTTTTTTTTVTQPKQLPSTASPVKLAASTSSLPTHPHTRASAEPISIPIPAGYQELDNETFACSWLKATYEISPQRCVSLTDIYDDYQGACIKLAKKGLIGPTQLSNYVRSVFPHVMPRRSDAVDSTVEGIRRRLHPLPVSIVAPIRQTTAAGTPTRGKHHPIAPHGHVSPASPPPSVIIPPSSNRSSPSGGGGGGGGAQSSHSPILKAQLSAPPRSPPPPPSSPSSSSSPAVSSSQSPPSSPTNGAAASKDSSSLIKSLLATKVSQNIQRQQLKQQQHAEKPAAVVKTLPVGKGAVRTTTTQLGAMLGHCEPPKSPTVTTGAVARQRPTASKRPVLLAPKAARINGVQRVVLLSPAKPMVNAKVETTSAATATTSQPIQIPPSRYHNSGLRFATADAKQQTLQNGSQQQQQQQQQLPRMMATSHASSFTAMSLDAPSIFKCLELAKTQNNAEVSLFSSVSSPVIPRAPQHANKGVLADLLDGKVNKVDTLLGSMNGIIEKKALPPPSSPLRAQVGGQMQNHAVDAAKNCSLTNGDNGRAATIRSTATVTTATIATVATTSTVAKLIPTTTVVVPNSSFENILSKYPNTTFSVGGGEIVSSSTTLRGATTAAAAAAAASTMLVKQCGGDPDEIIGFPRVSIDQLNRVQTKSRYARIEPKRPASAAVASSSTMSDANASEGGGEAKKIRLDDAIAALIPPIDGTSVNCLVGEPPTTTPTTTTTTNTASSSFVAVSKVVARVNESKPSSVNVVSTVVAAKIPPKIAPAPATAVASTMTTATVVVPATPKPPAPPVIKREYVCEWKNCKTALESASAVFLHACRVHAPPGSSNLPCLWENCDQMIRQRFSLMTHLQDRHCTESALRLEAARRKEIVQSGKTSIPPPPAPPPHPGYAPNAALHAIKRHALEFQSAQDVPEETESPLTKSVRLTAALILRSLVKNSPLANRCVRQHESYLATIAFSDTEASRTIAHLLGLLSDDSYADAVAISYIARS